MGNANAFHLQRAKGKANTQVCLGPDVRIVLHHDWIIVPKSHRSLATFNIDHNFGPLAFAKRQIGLHMRRNGLFVHYLAGKPGNSCPEHR